MKLQVFDNVTSRKYGDGRPTLRTISVYMSNGSITFSSQTAKELGIKENSKVLFAKDTDTRKDWYFAVSGTFDNGIKVRPKKNGGICKDVVSMSCSCRVVVEGILADHKATKNALFLVSAKGKEIDGVKWYQIVTKPLKIDGKGITE